jgi:POT family proton-dependent oligopeptide transporter
MGNNDDAAIQPGHPEGGVAIRAGHPPAAPTTHPPAIWFFFWGEFAERSSYYGMRTILFLYMTLALRMADTDAGPLYSAFKMACYFLPLLGGIIADRWLGRYWTIVGFSVPYVVGQFLIGIPNDLALYLALALLAGGSGVIKPNISTLMGQTYDQKRPGQDQLRVAAFNWFYMSINIGALISTLSLPIIRDNYILNHLSPEARVQAEAAAQQGQSIFSFASPEIIQAANRLAFAFPAGLMVLALLVFAAGKPFYAKETTTYRPLTPEERHQQWRTLMRLFGIFALVVIFWVGYEHNDTLWVAVNRDYVDLRLPFAVPVPEIGWPITVTWLTALAPDQLQFLNALFVILLIPVFNVLFGVLDPKGTVFTSMRRILAGFVLTAAAISIMSAASFLAQAHIAPAPPGAQAAQICTAKVSVFWPVAAYIVLTIGEVLLYGTMLELAYSAAPANMKSFVTACFLMTNAVGNLINMGWTKMYGGSLRDELAKRGPLPPGQFFAITAGVVLAAAVAFVFIGRQFDRSRAEPAGQ